MNSNEKIKKIITSLGGATSFAKLTKIPIRTVQNWLYGIRKPSQWLVDLIEKAIL